MQKPWQYQVPPVGVVLLTLILAKGVVQADSTIDATGKYAYSANAGWINARPDQPVAPAGVVFGDAFLSGFAYAANFGWIDFGGGAPTNGIRYGNDSATDFGVNHDGSGNLSGFAYAGNIGWINFGWASSVDPNRPRVNLLTGDFAGFAYSGNIGWINLSTGLVTTSMVCIDGDGDGISDSYEQEVFGDLSTANALSNFDRDPATDAQEFLAGTDPLDPASFLRILSANYNATFTQADLLFTTSPTRVYRIESSDGLGLAPDAWVDSGLGLFAPDPATTTLRSVSWSAADRRFFRAVAIKPLSE